MQSFSGETPFSLTLAALPKTQTPEDLKTLLGAEMPPRGLAGRVLKRVPSEDCQIEAIEIPSAPRVWLPAWLFRPKTGAPVKSVLMLIEPGGRNNGWQEGGLYQALAAEGHIVCVPDVRGVGDLMPEIGRGAAHMAASHNREEAWAWGSLVLGKPLLGQRVTDILAAQEALRHYEGVGRHPFIVAARGEMTVPAQMAAALDANFSALYLSGGLLSFRNILETEYYTHPFANFMPGVLRHTDLTELPSPKRVVMAGVVNAAGQPVPMESVKAAYSRLANLEVKVEGLWDVATLGSLASPVA